MSNCACPLPLWGFLRAEAWCSGSPHGAVGVVLQELQVEGLISFFVLACLAA